MTVKQKGCAAFEDKALNIDRFGQTFSFKLPNGKSRYRTWSGVCISLLLFIIIIGYSTLKADKVWHYGDTDILLLYTHV